MPHRLRIVCFTLVGLLTSAAALPDPCALQPQYLFFFALNQADPTAPDPQQAIRQNRGEMLIDAIANGWKASRGPLLITGHIDEAEARTVPHLDAARADAVRDALVQKGVDPSAITTHADAFNHPMVPKPGSEVQNRYVTVVAPEAGATCVPIPGTIR